MHDTVEENVAVSPDKRASYSATPRDNGRSGEISLEKGASPLSPDSQTELADRATDKNTQDRNQRSTYIGVEEAMPGM
jgi:hypothetical protein